MKKHNPIKGQSDENLVKLVADLQKRLLMEMAKKKMAFDYIISKGKVQEFKEFCSQA